MNHESYIVRPLHKAKPMNLQDLFEVFTKLRETEVEIVVWEGWYYVYDKAHYEYLIEKQKVQEWHSTPIGYTATANFVFKVDRANGNLIFIKNRLSLEDLNEALWDYGLQAGTTSKTQTEEFFL